MFDVNECKDQIGQSKDNVVFNINLRDLPQDQSSLVITCTLNQKNYDKEAPTTFSLTLATLMFRGNLTGEDLPFSYHSSVVSQDQDIRFVSTGPFKHYRSAFTKCELLLIVDGIWKVES